jgi:phosphate/sulfate permease
MLAVAYIFFIPFLKRKLIKQDPRLRAWHIPLGPLLLRDDPPLYFPGKGEEFVKDYYADAHGEVVAGRQAHVHDDRQGKAVTSGASVDGASDESRPDMPHTPKENGNGVFSDEEKALADAERRMDEKRAKRAYVPPRERFLAPVQDKSWLHPAKWWGWTKYILLRGITIDVVTHDSELLRSIHAKANRYDVRVEHMWTYCQVISAIMMSIAHGSNDVSNAVGPWVATYRTYQAGAVDSESPTPVWFLVIAGALLGIGFWFFGYHIIRSLGSKSASRHMRVDLG